MELREQARNRGIEYEYSDALGVWRVASDASIAAALKALDDGLPAADVELLWDGHGELSSRRRHLSSLLALSDEGERWQCPVTDGRISDVPWGVHTLDDGGFLISAPRECFGASRREWGVFAPLYSMHDSYSPHCGDFGTLARALDHVRSAGAACLATLPLLPIFAERGEPSPYSPVSRLFWNEYFVDPLATPEWSRSTEAQTGEAKHAPHGDFLDWQRFAESRLRTLVALSKAMTPERKAELQEWHSTRPLLSSYLEARAKGLTADDKEAFRYAQWVAETQLENVGRQGGLYLDLPLGVHYDGFDAQQFESIFAKGVSAGAPPDPLFEGGQNWGFRPLHPEADRRNGYAYLRSCFEHHMKHASVLRIDHAAWLHRLFWIPDGHSATDGVYVHQSQPEELHALLSLYSHRHRCRVIGEDLGTVPDAVRSAMTAHREGRTWVFYFALRDWGWEAPPEGSVATINTHDLATFAGYWRETDIDDWLALGLYDPARAQQAREERDQWRRRICAWVHLPEDATPREVHDRIVLAVAQGPGDLVLVTLEDLWQEERPQNVPGTWKERPNWMRRGAKHWTSIEAPEDAGFLAELSRRRSG